MDQSLRNEYAEKFSIAYEALNPAQKQAVDHIYGPVMVIAGPGTGKTQLLALRVCNILQQTDVSPNNILCLTFTEAGTIAMRERLLRFMGPDAHKVGIYTYHSFCNKILRENPYLFGDFFEFQNADDVEVKETIIQLIEELPLEHPLKRNTGNRFYDLKSYIKVFNAMKQERWTAEDIEIANTEYRDTLPTLEKFTYKRPPKGMKVGDPKLKDIEDEMSKYDFVLHASKLIGKYKNILDEKGRIDFNDSITYVLDMLKNNEDLKLRYQEQFQFILADEYQDTNGSQNEILFLLGDYDETPNLFVVGDDDQAIYRFQGANLYNIVNFMERFNPTTYVLTNNYRSQQHILDRAVQLINHNDDRLTKKYPDLVKNLTQHRSFGDASDFVPPQLAVYKNISSLEVGLIERITQLHQEGVRYSDISIIYRNHKEVVNLIKYLSFKGIPLNIKRRVNILEQPEIKRILALLHFILGEYRYPDSQKTLLFEILHFDFFKLNTLDNGSLAVYASKSKKDEELFSWRKVMSTEQSLVEAGVRDPASYLTFHRILEEMIGSIPNLTPQLLLEKLITATGMLDYMIKNGDGAWKLQLVNRFFDFVKDLTAKDGYIDMEAILAAVQKRVDFDVDISITNMVSAANGLNFMTAHGSKGLEFDYVFILNASSTWMSKPPEKAKFPPTLLKNGGDETIEDERRLFYVALTRAGKYCCVMYPKENNDGKALEALPFLSELGFDMSETIASDIGAHVMMDYINITNRLAASNPVLIDGQLIDQVIANMSMNATGVSKYLKCPISFYFENILRVPSARKAAPGYGSALHHALEQFFNEAILKHSYPDEARLSHFFEMGMDIYRSHFTNPEFGSHLYEGKIALTQYYQEQKSKWELFKEIKAERKLEGEVNGIPIKGILDRIGEFDGFIEVVDYKTGSFKYDSFSRPKDDKHGGDYWRQAVFYRILADKVPEYKGKSVLTSFHYLAKDETTRVKEVTVTPEDIEIVTEQITTVYNAIKSHQFDKGCDDCHWCAFVKENMGIDEVMSLMGNEADDDFEETGFALSVD
ncbi:MAG: ATP-dependent helicase [Saprospiraceae bacterium]|nr:ATP-dependent helicase [Saprospiraceae bacterium]